MARDPDHLDVGPGVRIPLAEVDLRATRSSGPGGQHANVTESRIVATFDVDASETLTDAQKARVRGRLGARVTAVAQDARSQARNRALALERLEQRIASALHQHRPRRATRPTASSRRARADSKRRRAAVKRARQRPGADD
jgi:ribosome-associated protein